MGLEAATYINQLNSSFPVGASDPKGQGDDHLRLIKSTIQASFPNIAGAMTLSHAQLNDAAQLTASNNFSGALQTISGVGGLLISNNAGGYLVLSDADAPLNQKRYRILNNGGVLSIATETDAGAGTANVIVVGRTGTVVDSIALTATTITVNGVATSDFARLSQNNTFAGYQSIVGAGSGALVLSDNTAAANEKRWRLRSIAGLFALTTETDAGAGTTDAITVDRTGTTVDSVALTATIVTANRARFQNASEAFAITGVDAIGDCFMAFYENQAYATRKGFLGFSNGGDDTFRIWNEENSVMALGTNANDRLTIEAGGQIYGNNIHNNAGGATGTANGYIASGTYTPTLNNTTNIAASTSAVCQWMRVGNVVTVSGVISIDPTAGAGTLSSLGISLPIASNFTIASQCGGTAVRAQATNIPFEAIKIKADTANDRAQLDWVAADAANLETSFTFTYLVV